jgi:hypothetical protein
MAKSTQIYLDDKNHEEMKKIVALINSTGKRMTNRQFIEDAIKEKIERERK